MLVVQTLSSKWRIKISELSINSSELEEKVKKRRRQNRICKLCRRDPQDPEMENF